MPKLLMGVTDLPYSVGSTSTGDVAEILEARYGIAAKFVELYGDEIADMVGNAMQDKLEATLLGAPVNMDEILNPAQLSEISQLFRDMLNNRELDGQIPGVPTQASLGGGSPRFTRQYVQRGPRPSFIATGLYSQSFVAWVEE